MTFKAIECESVSDALSWADASGGQAILIDGNPVVVTDKTANRLAKSGIEFAYLFDHELENGSFRIVSVPVN